LVWMKRFAPILAIAALLAGSVATPVAAAAPRPDRAGPASYTAIIANNCDDPTFSVCAEYAEESEYATFQFNADGTGSAVGRVSIHPPSGTVTYYGVMHITHWWLAPGNPFADFFPGTEDFYAQGTMDLTITSPAGTTHEQGMPLGLPFIEAGPGSYGTPDGVIPGSSPDGDTGVTLKLGLSRITTLYPPLSGGATPLQVPSDVPLYLFVKQDR
jgi:hypothetical protein